MQFSIFNGILSSAGSSGGTVGLYGNCKRGLNKMDKQLKYKLRFLESELIQAMRRRDFKAARRLRKAGRIRRLGLSQEIFSRLAYDFYLDDNYHAVYVLASLGMDLLYISEEYENEVWRLITENSDCYRIMRKLVKTGLIPPTEYENLFHLSAGCGNVRLMAFLLPLEVDINSTFSGGWQWYTPLMRAVVENRLESVKFLLENGADITAKDGEDKTVMEYQMTVQIRKEFYKNSLKKRRLSEVGHQSKRLKIIVV
jgi:ankyrin repeat protein